MLLFLMNGKLAYCDHSVRKKARRRCEIVLSSPRAAWIFLLRSAVSLGSKVVGSGLLRAERNFSTGSWARLVAGSQRATAHTPTMTPNARCWLTSGPMIVVLHWNS